MKRFLVIIALMTLLFGAAGQADALPFSSSNLSVAVSDLGSITFVDFNNLSLEATLVEKTFDNLDPISAIISYTSADLDFTNPSNGFRFIERITNNTGFTWTDYHIEVEVSTGGFLNQQGPLSGDAGVPNQAQTDYDSPTIGQITQVDDLPSIATITGGLVLDIDLFTPILDNEVLEIHFDLRGLAADGEFTLTQNPTIASIPEPATILLFGSGLLGLAAGFRKKWCNKG